MEKPWNDRPSIVSGSECRRTGIAMVCPKRTTMNTPPREMSRAENESQPDCGLGTLPHQAPLSNPYVPFQRNNPARYPSHRALARGTLFPGLDLPFHGMVNADAPKTPQTHLMAMQLAMTELGLYLDTHPDDTDAVKLYRDYNERFHDAVKEYESKCGPIVFHNAGQNGVWDWINGPWPWEQC